MGEGVVAKLEDSISHFYKSLGGVQGTPCHLYVTKEYLAWGVIDVKESSVDDIEFEDKPKRLKWDTPNVRETITKLFTINDAIKIHSTMEPTALSLHVDTKLHPFAELDLEYGVLIRTLGKRPEELSYEKDGEVHSRIEEIAMYAVGLSRQSKIPLVQLYEQWKPRTIVAELDKYVIGQSEAKSALARTAYWHLQRIHDIEMTGNTSMENQSLLLLGPTGSGKTLLSKKLGEILGLPFVVRDGTALTSAGFVGEDIEDYMREMWEISGGNIKRLQYGLFLIDEIDKLADSGQDGEINGKGAQQRLLRFTEGSRIYMGTDSRKAYPGPDYLDSSHSMKIFSGSFTGKGRGGIEDIIKKRVHPKTLGFGSNTSSPAEFLTHIMDEDLLEFGILRELAARMMIKACTKDLTVDNLRQILTEPKGSIIEQYKRSFRLDGHSLGFSPDALLLIAKEAKKRGSNARSLRPIVDLILGPIQEELSGEKPMTIEITEKKVEDAFGKKGM